MKTYERKECGKEIKSDSKPKSECPNCGKWAQSTDSKHAPGPWRIQVDGYGAKEQFKETNIRSDSVPPGQDFVCTVPNEANAHLIAAAPEMLGVLYLLMARTEADRTEDAIQLTTETYKAIRHAIAKAEGRDK